jgi:predicted ester cyclase
MKKLHTIMLLVISLCFIFGCQSQTEKGIIKEEAKAITDQILKIWNLGDLSLVDGLYAPDYIRHHPVPLANASLNDFKNTIKSNKTLFPDYNLSFEKIIPLGDRIIVFATVAGTNTASSDEMPATGKKIHMEGIYVYRISEGIIAEEWTYFNLLSYYEQLGFTLSPPLLKEPDEKK